MTAALLVMDGVTKSFSGFQALKGVDFQLRAGEVHALVGKNGAGKSTLMKLLAGAHLPDGGRIVLDGKAVAITSPHIAQNLGIAIVYQEFSLIKSLSTAENIFLGRLPRRGGSQLVDWAQLNRSATAVLGRLQSTIEPQISVAELSVAQQQVVEIAKALSVNPRILILDEPTSALSENETPALFSMIRSLRDEGVGIVYISHRLAEIEQIADYVTILRDGATVGEGVVADMPRAEIVRNMVGEQLAAVTRDAPIRSNKVLLHVDSLTRGALVRNISFDLHEGEILGIAGLVGAGRTELVRTLFGLDSPESGTISYGGETVSKPNPRKMKRLGMAFAPEDRKTQGLIVEMSVRHNIGLTILERLRGMVFLSETRERATVQRLIQELEIAVADSDEAVQRLSGGNQQKVVLAKWLANEPSVLILDEPTRGIDVGAKAQLFTILERLAAQGVGIIFISSELEEVLAVSHRVFTMYNGSFVAEELGGAVNMQQVLLNATGG
jgi:ABC-type sugar transport system ATPase subunit